MRTILLVGHRATGKTSLLRDLAKLRQFETFDLDEVIAEEHSKSAADWVRESEPAFRQMEIQTLRRLSEDLTGSDPRPRVIAVGAGCLSFPQNAIVIWVHRDGWEEDALQLRDRLRDDMTFDEECAWMRANREPVWRQRAHLFFEIPSGRARHRSARDLATWIDWTLYPPESSIAKKTWLIADEKTVNRALLDVDIFGFAGVEIRDDLVSHAIESSKVLASVRVKGSEWLQRHPDAAMFDIDVTLLDDELQQLADLEPRPLIISSHPDGADPADVEALVRAARKVESAFPQWVPKLVLKYAPIVETFDQIGFARALISPIVNANIQTTFLPQGKLAASIRPILALNNVTNYLPVLLRSDRIGGGRHDHSPYDFQDWLPFLTVPQPSIFYGLIGEQAHTSQGDFWHRREALAHQIDAAYIKVDVPIPQLQSALYTLSQFAVSN